MPTTITVCFASWWRPLSRCFGKIPVSRLLMYAALEGHELAIMHHNQLALPLGSKLKEYIRRSRKRALSARGSRTVLWAVAGFAVIRNSEIHLPRIPMNCSDEHAVDVFMQILMYGLAPGEKRNEK